MTLKSLDNCNLSGVTATDRLVTLSGDMFGHWVRLLSNGTVLASFNIGNPATIYADGTGCVMTYTSNNYVLTIVVIADETHPEQGITAVYCRFPFLAKTVQFGWD